MANGRKRFRKKPWVNGYVILVLMHPTLMTVGPIMISTYGVLMVLAFFGGAFVVWKKGREEHFEEEDLFDVTLLTTFWALIGGRAWYVVTHLTDFGSDVVKMISLFRYPGLGFWGGILAGTVALAFFARAKKWRFLEIADTLVQGVSLAYVLGMMGAFLNGSSYGVRSNLPWAVIFPGVDGARHPAQIYGLILGVLMFWLLIKIAAEYRTYEWYKGGRAEAESGLAFFTWMVGFGLIEFGLALLKPASLYFGFLTIDGGVGLVVALVGIIGGYWRSGRKLQQDIKAVAGFFKGGLKMPKAKSTLGEGVKFKRIHKRRNRGITAGLDVK